MQNRHKTGKPRQTTGPGRLTWAWLGLIATLGAAAILIQTLGNPDADREIIALEITADPERTARLTPSPTGTGLRTITAPQETRRPEPVQDAALEEASVTPPVPPGGKIITLPVTPSSGPAPEEPTSDLATPALTPAQQERLQIMQDATAKVIRLDDLPSANAAKGSNIRPAGSAPPLPDTDLFVSTKDGPYPQIADNGRRAASYYARSFKDPADRPRIAIIIGGLGLSPELTQQAIDDLPPEITLAFAPYGKDLQGWASKARAAGHELMIELPMEATGMDPAQLGPAGLLSSRSPVQNEKRMNWLLSRFAGYFGVTNYLGNKLSTDQVSFAPVLDQIMVSGAAFIADNEISARAAPGNGPALRTDFLIGAKPGSILNNLASAEKIATSRQQVLIKIYPTPQSLTEISSWSKSLAQKGIVLAPASSLLSATNN